MVVKLPPLLFTVIDSLADRAVSSPAGEKHHGEKGLCNWTRSRFFMSLHQRWRRKAHKHHSYIWSMRLKPAEVWCLCKFNKFDPCEKILSSLLSFFISQDVLCSFCLQLGGRKQRQVMITSCTVSCTVIVLLCFHKHNNYGRLDSHGPMLCDTHFTGDF